MSLVARVPKIPEVALDTARKLAEDAGRQDSHMESKALAKYQAYINGMQARLTDDLCAFYEEPLSERIVQYSEETDESSAYRLNSPQRRALKAGKVKLLQSRFIVKTVELFDQETADELSQRAGDVATAIVNEPLESVAESAEESAEEEEGSPLLMPRQLP